MVGGGLVAAGVSLPGAWCLAGLFSWSAGVAGSADPRVARSSRVKARPEVRRPGVAGPSARSSGERGRSEVRLSRSEGESPRSEAGGRRLAGLSGWVHLTFKSETGRFKSVRHTSWVADGRFGSSDLPLSPADRAFSPSAGDASCSDLALSASNLGLGRPPGLSMSRRGAFSPGKRRLLWGFDEIRESEVQAAARAPLSGGRGSAL